MVEVLRRPLVPLLLAGALTALAGCSGNSEATTAPNQDLGTRSCTIGPTAGNNPGCDTLEDQSLAPRH